MGNSVFVLEDNQDLRELYTILLEEKSYQVTTFPTANSFKKTISVSLPDIIILDVMLPDGNGEDICKELKSNVRTSHIPIIMMSANSSLADVKNSCEVEEFISKPFDINQFIKKVNFYAKKTKTD